jgi:hypothetical protein
MVKKNSQVETLKNLHPFFSEKVQLIEGKIKTDVVFIVALNFIYIIDDKTKELQYRAI